VIASLPLRIKLTLPFAVAMALVLAATGAFVYVRVGSALLTSVDQTLRAQAAEALPRLRQGKTIVDSDAAAGGGVAQLLTRAGAVVATSRPGLPPLLVHGDRTRLASGRSFMQSSDDLRGLSDHWRLLVQPVRVGGAHDVLVVAHSLESRHETLDRLRFEFLVAAPAALLLATLAGYLLAGAAVRPVEAMRRRAAEITATTAGSRLPVPPSRDEVARLAETLNEMLARLESAFEHERRFLADASHELRTPLALLRTELELALRRPRSAAELEQALRSAADETERLSRLAEDLLLIARSDEGVLPVRRERLSAHELLSHVAERFGARAERLGRSVSVDGDDDTLLDADPVRLEQAIGNLVDNALTHGAGDVRLTVVHAPGRVELHVTDGGAGFAPDFVGRAFDRFSRADDARSSGGTGLGLAIVELIAAAHGGAAGVANREGGGADAWIALAPAAGRTPVPALATS